MPPTATQWVEHLARALGIEPPSAEEVDSLLGLAGVAAHSSERTAAPLSTWLAGRAGIAPAEAKALVEELAGAFAAEADGEEPRAGQPA